jgi:hypothetical protein
MALFLTTQPERLRMHHTLRPTSIALLTLLVAVSSTRAGDMIKEDSVHGDWFVTCKEWTALANDPVDHKRPWSESLFLRYANWIAGFVSGASTADPRLRDVSTPDAIQYARDYCRTNPSKTIRDAATDLVRSLREPEVAEGMQHRPGPDTQEEGRQKRAR